MRPRGIDPAKRWLSFLANHREVMVAFDFFTVPTLTFRLLYCFFVIEHERRKILHFNVTGHPTADWVVQQLREAFPEAGPYRYVILDPRFEIQCRCDGLLEGNRFGAEAHECSGTLAKWDRRAVGGKLPPRDPRPYHRSERTTSAAADSRLCELPPRRSDSRIPGKDTLKRRPVDGRPSPAATVISNARLGGLHHRYRWREAA
jgi:hypothetical protein